MFALRLIVGKSANSQVRETYVGQEMGLMGGHWRAFWVSLVSALEQQPGTLGHASVCVLGVWTGHTVDRGGLWPMLCEVWASTG